MYYFYYRDEDDDNTTTVDSVVCAVRSVQTQRPRRNVAKRVLNLFRDSDSEPEPEHDSDHEKDHEYTEKDAMEDADIESSDHNSVDEDACPLPKATAPRPQSKATAENRANGGENPLPYNPPSDIAPTLLSYRDRRHELMRQAFFDTSLEKDISWRPNENDVTEIQRCVLARYR